MKYTTLILLFESLLFASCKEQKDCDTPILPPIPTSPVLRLVDKQTGEDVYSQAYLTDSVEVKSLCGAIMPDISPVSGTQSPILFLIENIKFDEEAGGCKTVYLKLNAIDEDTLVIEGKGYTYNNNDPCGGNYEFVVNTVRYNGLEATKEKTNSGREYYLLKKQSL